MSNDAFYRMCAQILYRATQDGSLEKLWAERKQAEASEAARKPISGKQTKRHFDIQRGGVVYQNRKPVSPTATLILSTIPAVIPQGFFFVEKQDSAQRIWNSSVVPNDGSIGGCCMLLRRRWVRVVAAVVTCMLLGSVAMAQTAPPLTADQKAQIAQVRKCLPKQQAALAELDKLGEGTILLPDGCGWVEQKITVKESPDNNGYHQVCWVKKGGLTLLVGWAIQHCEAFTVSGSQITWAQDPPTVTPVTGIGNSAEVQSKGIQWITPNKAFRHYSNTKVSFSLFGYPIGSMVVPFEYYETANSHHH